MLDNMLDEDTYSLGDMLPDRQARIIIDAVQNDKHKIILGILLSPRGADLLAYISIGMKRLPDFNFNWLSVRKIRNAMGVELYQLTRIRDYQFPDFPEYAQLPMPTSPFRVYYTHKEIVDAQVNAETFILRINKYQDNPSYGAF